MTVRQSATAETALPNTPARKRPARRGAQATWEAAQRRELARLLDEMKRDGDELSAQIDRLQHRLAS